MHRLSIKKRIPLKLFDIIVGNLFSINQEKSKIDWININSILIIDTVNLIGDMIMLHSFISVLKKNATKSKITVVAKPITKEVFESQGIVDEFIGLSNNDSLLKKYKVINEINNKKYDIAINPRGDIRDIFLMRFINSTRKISFTRTGGEKLLTDPLPTDYSKAYSHEIEVRFDILNKIGCKFCEEDKYPKLRITDKMTKNKEIFYSKNKLKNRIVIGIHPGASGIIRRWDYYLELALMIKDRYNDSFFILFGGPDDYNYIQKIYNQLKNDSIIISGSITKYIESVYFCDFFISNDSSAAHIAAGYGLKTLTIFTNNVPEICEPYNFKHSSKLVNHYLPCKPCFNSNKCYKGTEECKKQITCEEVFNQFLYLLQKNHHL